MHKKHISLSLLLLLSVATVFAQSENIFEDGYWEYSEEKGDFTKQEGGFKDKATRFLENVLNLLPPVELSEEEENLIENCYEKDGYWGKFYDPNNNAVADYPNGRYYNNNWPIVDISKDEMSIYQNFGLPDRDKEVEEKFNVYTILRQPKLIGRQSSLENLDIECSGDFNVPEDEDPICSRLYNVIQYGENTEQHIFPVEVVITDNEGNKVARYRAVANLRNREEKNSFVILSSSFIIPLSGRCMQLHKKAFTELVRVAQGVGCNDIAHYASRMEVDSLHVMWFKELQQRGYISKNMSYHT